MYKFAIATNILLKVDQQVFVTVFPDCLSGIIEPNFAEYHWMSSKTIVYKLT